MTPAESDKNVDESINVYNFRTIGCHRVTSFVLTFHIFPRIAPPLPTFQWSTRSLHATLAVITVWKVPPPTEILEWLASA